ncbi:Na(+)-translocating NADH-quinone reductase subunit C [Kangiella sp. TOML190]|uniref:Na(+)-translocating NADH-quinone reductase subunit C n=1 Tax=Kangiella sp. TOML190 TaxID=2931351 RepID=UPI00203AC109|nr:Na(+)-translocating NADH-quinone reductase subunit C [Kangiella sp. TOML190]
MSKKESPTKTIVVALLLSLICSVVVSTAAIKLKPIQQKNQALDKKRNILVAAGMIESGSSASVEELFQQVESKHVDLATGEFVNVPPNFDQRKAAKNPNSNVALTAEQDLGGIGSRAQVANVYLVKKDGQLDSIIFPIHGKGLFSTLYGFIALDKDLKTVKGIKYYEHGETPGLGGEVENSTWLAKWPGKQALDANGEPVLTLVKSVPSNDTQVDALSGATWTTNGVQNMIHFWLGDNGFGPFLDRVRAGDI